MDDGNSDNRANSVKLELKLGLSLAIFIKMSKLQGTMLYIYICVKSNCLSLQKRTLIWTEIGLKSLTTEKLLGKDKKKSEWPEMAGKLVKPSF